MLRQRRSMPRSHHLPVDLFRSVDLFVAFLIRGKSERFLAAECEDAERGQAVVEKCEHSRLESFVEVNENVAAENDVELAERSIRDEIVLRENDVLRETRRKQRAVVFRYVVIRERALTTGGDVVLRVLLHSIERKDSRFCFLKHDFIDVCRINARPLVKPLLFQ